MIQLTLVNNQKDESTRKGHCTEIIFKGYWLYCRPANFLYLYRDFLKWCVDQNLFHYITWIPHKRHLKKLNGIKTNIYSFKTIVQKIQVLIWEVLLCIKTNKWKLIKRFAGMIPKASRKYLHICIFYFIYYWVLHINKKMRFECQWDNSPLQSQFTKS